VTVIQQVEAAVRATRSFTATSFSWFGKSPPPLPRRIRRALSPEDARHYLLASLQQQLYANFYTRGFASPIRWTPEETIDKSTTLLARELSAANCSSGYWSSGWTMESMARPRIVRSGSLRLLVPDDLFSPVDAGVPVVRGSRVRVRMPKELPNASPGFYVATSNREFGSSDEVDIVRLYWNVSPAGAVALTRLLTRHLNDQDLSFRLKALADPAEYHRCDSLVLYLRTEDLDSAWSVIERLYDVAAAELGSVSPVFTKRLAPGLGLAEDPPGRDSFGLHRCGVLARGLLRAHDEGRDSHADRCRVVFETFEEAAITLEAPYLNPGSSDRYAVLRAHRRTGHERSWAVESERACDVDVLDGARLVAEHLCRSAVWHGDRCTWMSRSWHHSPQRVMTTLGADLYDGLSGLAYFLALAFSATGDEELERTARGALAQARHRMQDIPSDERLSLYSGWVGIALVELAISRLLGDERLASQSADLVGAILALPLDEAPLDLMLGIAGTIVGLLRMWHWTADGRLAEVAVSLGDQLLAAAHERPEGCSWPTINGIKDYHLTGLSHGAAGIGLALLELYDVSHLDQHRLAAERAFHYEQHWFDPERGNWPDLREARIRHHSRADSLAFSSYWCHGAPGIGLSRLRAWEVLGSEQWKAQALVALETTRRAVRRQIAARPLPIGLCHGLVGNADILLTAHRTFGDSGEDEALARTVGATALRQLRRDLELDRGMDKRCEPGLMTGIAGVGLFFLRLRQAAVPSVLYAWR
jgi:hypothetical protein